MTLTGFCEVAPESRYTSGCPLTCWPRIGKSLRIRSTSALSIAAAARWRVEGVDTTDAMGPPSLAVAAARHYARQICSNNPMTCPVQSCERTLSSRPHASGPARDPGSGEYRRTGTDLPGADVPQRRIAAAARSDRADFPE